MPSLHQVLVWIIWGGEGQGFFPLLIPNELVHPIHSTRELMLIVNYN